MAGRKLQGVQFSLEDQQERGKDWNWLVLTCWLLSLSVDGENKETLSYAIKIFLKLRNFHKQKKNYWIGKTLIQPGFPLISHFFTDQ